jgi:hypothetical protein
MVVELMDEDMVRVLRAMTGFDRLKIASGMFASARKMLINHLRFEHPDWDESRVVREAARRLSHGAV